MNDVTQPQDHLEKVVKPKVERSETEYTVTHSGVTVSIPFAALDDFEMLRDLGRMQDPSVADPVKLTMVPAVFSRFFGDAQAGHVLNALRDPQTGRVKIATASEFLFDVFRALNPE